MGASREIRIGTSAASGSTPLGPWRPREVHHNRGASVARTLKVIDFAGIMGIGTELVDLVAGFANKDQRSNFRVSSWRSAAWPRLGKRIWDSTFAEFAMDIEPRGAQREHRLEERILRPVLRSTTWASASWTSARALSLSSSTWAHLVAHLGHHPQGGFQDHRACI